MGAVVDAVMGAVERKTDDVQDRYPIAIFLADVHYRMTSPEYRVEKDGFNRVIDAKLREVFAYIKEARRRVGAECANMPIPMFVAGDLFDKAREFTCYWSLADSLSEFGVHYSTMYVVRGQHDMFHHNPNERATNLNALAMHMTSPVEVIAAKGQMIRLDGGWCVFGCGWGESLDDVAKLVDKLGADGRNILVTHRTLWHKTPVYPGMTEGNVAVEASVFKKIGFSYVFSGDNHKAFDVEVDGVKIFNVGAFTRMSVDIATQQPRFCVLFNDGSVESVYVGKEGVFDLELSDADKGRKKERDEFSESLASGFVHQVTFREKLAEVASTGVCGDMVLNGVQCSLLRDVINEIGGV